MARLKLTSERQKNLPGKVFTTNNYGNLVIREYINSNNVLVEFLETGYQCHVQYVNIIKGDIRDRLANSKLQKLHYGIAITGRGKYLPFIHRDAYDSWAGMLKRCYDTKYHKKQPSYCNCSASEEWLNFQNYAEWYYVQKKDYGWNLDKDILKKFNKIYSAETSAFVPAEINMLFTKHYKKNNLPQGISLRNYRKIRPFLSRFGNEHLGYFSNVEDAFHAYKIYKEGLIKRMAEKYKDRLDQRVYNAMMKYQVEITD